MALVAPPHNPYAPPRTLDSSRHNPRVVRRGKTVHLFDGATLPPRCIKCNAPALQPMKKYTLYSNQAAIFRRKRTHLAIGMCRKHSRAKTHYTLLVCAVIIVGALCLYAGSNTLRTVGLALLLCTPAAALFVPQVATLSHIADGEIRLKGAKKSFLNSLPEE